MLKNKVVAALAALGLSFLSNVTEVNALDHPATLEGQTMRVEIVSEDTRSIQLEISLDLSLKNNSKSNIILYNSDFDIVNLVLFKSDSEAKSTTTLYSLGSRASNFNSSELADMQRKASLSIPSPDIATIIPPGKSTNLKKKTGLRLYKTTIIGYPNQSWEEILKASPVSLTIQLELFPETLNTKSDTSKSFGEDLKMKWESYGELQLDNIRSTPISLDLSTATVTKKSKIQDVAGKKSLSKKPITKQTSKKIWQKFKSPDATLLGTRCAPSY